MTIDERLDKLTERHEALTITVEHLAHIVQALESRHEALIMTVEKLAQTQRRAERRFNRFETIVLRLGEDFNERLRKLEESEDEEGGGPQPS